MACRDSDAATKAAEDIRKQCENSENVGTIHIEKLDVSNLESVRECAKTINENEERIDLLVNNAGVMVPFSRTEEGFELTFVTNHLGPFLFTLLLLSKICKSTPARIVNISSALHSRATIPLDDLNWNKREYSAWAAYSDTKLANVLFTQELAKRLADAEIQGVNVYSVHPGIIRTELNRQMDKTTFRGAGWLYNDVLGWFMKTPQQGAQTTIYCSVDEKCANETGLYYVESAVAKPGKVAQNKEEVARKLWEDSLKLAGLPEDHNPFV